MSKIKSLIPLALIFVAACERTESTPTPRPPPPIPDPTPPPEPDPTPPPAPGANVIKVFPAGSLIIPTSGTYQTPCGAVSAYGLVYNVLRANNWLAANGFTKVRVYYGFKNDKLSPNRCVPTNKHTAPSPSADPSWNDGCDFTVNRALGLGGRPVREVNNTSGTNAATDFDLATISTTGSSSIFPTYGATTVDAATNRVGYLGAPFIIDQPNAATFLGLLQGTINALDDFGVPIDFAPFRTFAKRSTCTFPNPGTVGTADEHYVRIHRAQAAFSGNNNLSFTATPPRLALLATNNAGMTARVDDGILQKYLTNAGLNFTGANGCPPGGKNASKKSICPKGGTPGLIYDSFDFADIRSNLHALTDGTGKPLYSSVWAPHWESTAGSTSNPNANEITAVNNLDTWLLSQNGFMGECHSIEAIEGAYRSGSKSQTKTKEFLTCLDANSDGVCDVATTKWGIDKRVSGTPTGRLRNCSDVNLSNGSTCAYHGYPGDSFSQTADYMWDAVGGSVDNWKPNPAEKSIYRPGTFVQISGVSSLDKTKLANPTLARAMIRADYVTYGFKNSNPAQGAIHYLGGHDQSSSLSGNLVVMQTLLQLGTPPTTVAPVIKEVSRSSPVIANVNGTEQLYQGTFEKEVPLDLLEQNLAADADLATFEFPSRRGHFRGFQTSDITTTTENFTDVGSTFDAANFIPNPNYTGCGTYFTSSCRTVWTNIQPAACAAGGTCRLPDSGNGPGKPLFVNQAAKAVLAPIMFPGISVAQRDNALSRVLAGFNNAGTYIPKLGGIDRSTVTIVGPSNLDGGTAGVRPTMGYVGAADGMLHAICLNATGPCDQIGRELWAFLPRSQLAKVASNTAVVDGSPRAVDIFGDFDNDGSNEFRTILTFATSNHTSILPTDVAAVYAVDITDPQDPRLIWEYSTPTIRGQFELGNGLTIAMARAAVNIPVAATKNVTFVQTNNFGVPFLPGELLTAIDTETGAALFRHTYAYPNPTRAAGAPEIGTGVPGGAVGVDITLGGTGTITDIVFGDLYGNLWQIATNAPLHTGTNTITPKNGFDPGLDATPNTADDIPIPIFTMSTDQKPIGVPPAIFAQLPYQYAVFTTGGYADPFGLALWAAGIHKVVAVRLLQPAEPLAVPGAPFTELSTAPDPIKFQADLDATAGNDRGFSQALVVGNEIFVTTDSSDVNDNTDLTGYGIGTPSGNTYKFDIAGVGGSSGIVIAGGASSLVNAGTNVYGAASSGMQQLSAGATSTVGTKVDYTTSSAAKVTRVLWLRGQ